MNPLAVFVKHAKAGSAQALQQKPEEILLAQKMLAICVLWQGGNEGMDHPRGKVPPPFEGLSSHCVVGAARKAGADAFAARSKFLTDSYRLLAASSLGKHPQFSSRCPPHVYSHCLGLIDQNAACTSAISASHMHAALAGVAPAVGAKMAEGLGIYPVFSLANHACVPNAINAKGPADKEAVLDNALVLRAGRRIDAGEEVAFDYLDSAHERGSAQSQARHGDTSATTTAQRVQEHFGFRCKCTSCERRTP